MKPDKNFKMPKQYKIMASRILDSHKRGQFLKLVAMCHIYEEAAKKAPLQKDKE